MSRDDTNHGHRLSEAERRGEIVEAARALFTEKGLARTSIKDVTERVGVSRSLFYHYFPDKDALTDAVMADFVADFVEMAHIWNDGRIPGDIEGDLRSCVRMLKQGVVSRNPFRADLIQGENAEIYLRFSSLASDRLAHYVIDTTVVDYGRVHPIEIGHLYETFYILIAGLIAYLRHNPDADEEMLMAIIADTLHLEPGTAAEAEADAGRRQ